jgi:hypothetical protein
MGQCSCPGFGVNVSVELCKLQCGAGSMKCAGWLTLMHASGTSTIADGAEMGRRASTAMTMRADFTIGLLGGILVSVDN